MIRLDAIVHRAGEPEGLIQRCSDCREILVGYTDAMGVGQWVPRWWEGDVTVTSGNPKAYVSGKVNGAIRCNQKPS